ncbi:MAG: 50S ribosomal protein L10 [Anaerolineae bacterium]|nr:50S ribosomal protein L10 [Anaerolineae bacterium]
MAINRERKERLVAQYIEMLGKTGGFVVVQSQGLNVQEVEGLRAVVRGAGGKYIVTKNTLLTIALKQAGWQVPENLLNGPVAIALGMDNLPGVAKAVLEYGADATRTEKMKVTGAQMGESTLSAAQVDALSKLPSLDELRAQIIGLVVSPAEGLVSVLQQATAGVINVIQALEDQSKEGAA